MALIGTVEGILKLVDDFTAPLNKAIGQFQRAGQKMQQIGQRTSQAGASMTRGLTVPLALIGVGSVKAFGNFDDAMTGSLAIMDNVSAGMQEDMEQTARTVATTLVPSATEAAESFFFLASAGLNAESSIQALPKVAEFAQAGLFDMARATDLLTDAQSALGLTIRDDAVANMENMVRVSDVLVKANKLANASVEQFSVALTTEAGAALKSFNIDVEEGVAVLAAFADQGVKGEKAGSGLSRILRLMTAGVEENQEAYDELNVRVFDASGNINSLADIIGDLENAFEGMSDKQRVASLQALGFQARVQGIILPLLGTSEAIRGYENDLRNAAGTTAEVSANQMQSFSKQMGLVKAQLVEAAIELGSTLAPTLKNFTDNVVVPGIAALTQMAILFGSLPEPVQTLVIAVAALTAVAGPLLFIAGQLLIAFGALAPVLPVIAAGFGTLLGPVGLVTAGLVALVAVANTWIALQGSLAQSTNSNVASTQDYGMALNNLRIELTAAQEGQRELNAELVNAVGEGLPQLGAQLEAAQAKLAKLKDEAKATAIEMGSDKFGGAIKVANERVEEQEGLVANLSSQWKAAQKLLAQAAEQGFVPLKESIDAVSGAQGSGGLEELNSAVDEAVASLGEASAAAVDVETDFSSAIEPLEASALAFDELGDAATTAAEDTVAASSEAQEATDLWAEGFTNAIADAIIGADDLGDALKELFVGQAKQNLTKFVTDFTSGMSTATEAGKSGFASMKEAGKSAFDNLAGGADVVSVAFGAATGEWEGLAVGAMTAISKFASGDWVGAMIAAIGVVVGAFKKLFGGGKSLAEEIDDAFKALADGVATMEEMGAAGDILVKTLTRVAAGQNSVAGGTDVLAKNFDAFFDAAVKMGDAGLESIKAVVEAAREAGVDMTVIQEKLDETLEKAAQAAADRTKFIEDQSRTILSSIEALFSGVGRVTRREVRFAATSVLQAFESMRVAGLPLTQIMAEIGGAVGLIGGRADELGLQLPKAFERFGEVLEILATTKITKVIGKVETMGATVEAVGNLGLLTAGQFDTFGDRVDKAFTKLTDQGLTSKEALATLAPQLQQLQDFSEQYGFVLDENTQKLVDQAKEQGLVAEKGLTTEDILIKGFDRMIETLNALIEAMGGVPVAFDEWADTADDTTDTVVADMETAADASEQAMMDIASSAVDAAAQTQVAWQSSLNSLPAAANSVANQIASQLSGIPISFNVSTSGGPSGEVLSAQAGTGGFMDFGAGTPAILHGNEQVVTAAEGVGIAEMVASAIARGGGGSELGEVANVEATKEVSDGISELTRVVRGWQADTIARTGAGTDRRWRQPTGKAP